MSENKDLIILENKTATDVFMEDNGIDGILEEIARRAREHDLDVTTEKGRKEIASVAFKIARSKTTLDNAGKQLTADWREQTSKVNASRKKATEFLDKLKDEIRKPLTEYENAEKERVAIREARIKDLDNLTNFASIDDGNTDIIEMCNIQLSKINELLDFDWQEFKSKAEKQADISKEYLTNKLNNAIALKKENDRIAKEAEEKRLAEQKAREEEIARKAKEQAEQDAKAKIEAERKAKEEAEARAKAQEEARIKAEQDVKVREEQRIAREKAEAEKKKAIAEQLEKDEKTSAELIEEINKICRVFVTQEDCDDFRKSLKAIEVKAENNIPTANIRNLVMHSIQQQINMICAIEIKIEREQKKLADEKYIKEKKTETFNAIKEVADMEREYLIALVNAIYDGKIPNVKVEV